MESVSDGQLRAGRVQIEDDHVTSSKLEEDDEGYLTSDSMSEWPLAMVLITLFCVIGANVFLLIWRLTS